MAWRSIQVDNRHFSFKECWYLAPGWLSRVILLFAKVFRIRLKMGQPMPMAANAREYQIPAEDVPGNILNDIQPLLKELTDLGFHSPQFSMATARKTRQIDVCTVSLLHRSGEMLAHLPYSKSTAMHPPLLRIFVAFETPIGGGRCVTSSSGARQMDPVSGERVWFHTGMPVGDLFETHRQHLGELKDAAAERIESVARLWEILEESHQKMLTERLTRGVWKEVRPELGESEPVVTTLPPPLPENSDSPVLAELEKLQKGRKGWGTAMVVFGITLLLFVVIGSWQWDWRFAAMLVPILLFHELGHYVAMRLFGYQNLRIFFVPFFGAAVTGLRLNAPGWQQAIVALAGPIPGILAGWGMMVAALHGDYYWLERFGRLCVIVNGFNLLPILPLDGGRILNSLLFARNRWLEASAVVLAAIGLAVLNYLGMGRIFLFLAFFMLFGLPRVWLIARLTALIRAKGFSPDAPSAQTISREAALAILAAIRANHLPKAGLGPRTMAQMVASIYERLHTKAPGWLAVTGLLVVHGAALGAAAYLGFQAFSLRWQKPLLPDEIFEPVKTTLAHPTAGLQQARAIGAGTSRPHFPIQHRWGRDVPTPVTIASNVECEEALLRSTLPRFQLTRAPFHRQA